MPLIPRQETLIHTCTHLLSVKCLLLEGSRKRQYERIFFHLHSFPIHNAGAPVCRSGIRQSKLARKFASASLRWRW